MPRAYIRKRPAQPPLFASLGEERLEESRRRTQAKLLEVLQEPGLREADLLCKSPLGGAVFQRHGLKDFEHLLRVDAFAARILEPPVTEVDVDTVSLRPPCSASTRAGSGTGSIQTVWPHRSRRSCQVFLRYCLAADAQSIDVSVFRSDYCWALSPEHFQKLASHTQDEKCFNRWSPRGSSVCWLVGWHERGYEVEFFENLVFGSSSEIPRNPVQKTGLQKSENAEVTLFCVKLSIYNHIVRLVHKNHIIRTRLMYHAACKVEFQPFKRSYSQLTFFNLKKKKKNSTCIV